MASKNWIQSWSGKKLEPLNLTKEMVGDAREIAHALSLKNRFTGQTSTPYSVAEHVTRGSRLLSESKLHAQAFALHEASEVYLPDIASPIKPEVFVRVPDPKKFVQLSLLARLKLAFQVLVGRVVPWVELERQHAHVILGKLGLDHLEPLLYSSDVKSMDLAMLAAEKRDLMGAPPEAWGIESITPANTGKIEPWAQPLAERTLLAHLRVLFGDFKLFGSGR